MSDYVEQTTALIGRVEGTELLPHAIRLLSDGEPVALERLAAAAGSSVEDAEAALTVQTSAERTIRDDWSASRSRYADATTRSAALSSLPSTRSTPTQALTRTAVSKHERHVGNQPVPAIDALA
jgi:Helix-turn-helix domain of alkylmercury lyase